MSFPSRSPGPNLSMDGSTAKREDLGQPGAMEFPRFDGHRVLCRER